LEQFLYVWQQMELCSDNHITYGEAAVEIFRAGLNAYLIAFQGEDNDC